MTELQATHRWYRFTVWVGDPRDAEVWATRRVLCLLGDRRNVGHRDIRDSVIQQLSLSRGAEQIWSVDFGPFTELPKGWEPWKPHV